MANKHWAVSVVATAFLVFPGAAWSAPDVYANGDSFLASVGSRFTDDYESASYSFLQSNAQMTAVHGETRYESTGFANNNVVANVGASRGYCAGCNGSFKLYFDNTSFGASNGVFGVGLDVVLNQSAQYDAFVEFGDGSSNNYANLATGFFGVTSSSMIKSIAFGPNGGQASMGGAFAIDNLTIAAQIGAPTEFYSDFASFSGAIGNGLTDDYENPEYQFLQSNAQMSAVLGETRYLSTGFSDLNIVSGTGNHSYCAGCNGSFQLFFDSTSVGSSDGVFGISFDVLDNSARLYDALVLFGDGSSRVFDSLKVGFFGLTSSLLIKSISFGPNGGQPSTQGNFVIDNLTIGSARVVAPPVPEPAGWAMMVLGIGTVGALLRRHRATVTYC